MATTWATKPDRGIVPGRADLAVEVLTGLAGQHGPRRLADSSDSGVSRRAAWAPRGVVWPSDQPLHGLRCRRLSAVRQVAGLRRW